MALGISGDRILVIGNGVDTDKFQPLPQDQARDELGLPVHAPVLVTVGGLCERKGFHRVIECLPDLRKRFPAIRYLVVGGPSPEGDWTERLKRQVAELGLNEIVSFLGSFPAARLKVPLSAGNVFVLATRNEGWANVFLEAMACGLPVIATDVGGNSEVVCRRELGAIVPFGDQEALTQAIAHALETRWNQSEVIKYAHANSWDGRVAALISEFREIAKYSGANISRFTSAARK
jgi:glycosyltransferase involved in cell wall biosynthesis